MLLAHYILRYLLVLCIVKNRTRLSDAHFFPGCVVILLLWSLSGQTREELADGMGAVLECQKKLAGVRILGFGFKFDHDIFFPLSALHDVWLVRRIDLDNTTVAVELASLDGVLVLLKSPMAGLAFIYKFIFSHTKYCLYGFTWLVCPEFSCSHIKCWSFVWSFSLKQKVITFFIGSL